MTIDTILIGGAGIIGLLQAYRLQKQWPKAQITLCDPQGFPARNASALAGGMLAPYSEAEFLPSAFVQIGLMALNEWEIIARETKTPFFHRKGSLFVAHSSDSHSMARAIAHFNDKKCPYTYLDEQKITEIEPDLAKNFSKALYFEDEGHLSPKNAIKSLLKTLKHVQFIQKPLKTVRNTQDFDWIIDCTGYTPEHQNNTPQISTKNKATMNENLRGVKGETLTVRNPEFSLTRPVRLMHPRYPLYIIPRDDHHFMVGATIIESPDEAFTLRSNMELSSALYTLHDSFANTEIIEYNAGIRPAYPDNLPRIIIDKDSRTISCNGVFRHGYLLGPIMANVVADYMAGHHNPYIDHFTKDETDAGDNQRAA